VCDGDGDGWIRKRVKAGEVRRGASRQEEPESSY